MRERAQPKVRAYAEISPEANEIKLRLLQILGVSNNALAEMAYRALDAEQRCRAATDFRQK
jgi:hypothetical protein